MIKILIVDDSLTETMLLKSIFENEKDFEVVGIAKNGKDCLKKLKTLKPDIITMDILMPEMDGLETTRQIMSQFPIPIVIISSTISKESVSQTFDALDAGALAVLEKPEQNKEFEKSRTRIIDIVRSMSEIHVIKRRFFTKRKETKPILPLSLHHHVQPYYEIIAIAASVGGPQALKKILTALPRDFPLPIVIVQHMMHGFINGFTTWLNNTTHLVIKSAENHEILKGGTVYFAPDHHHMEVKHDQYNLRIKLQSGPPISGFRPSATVLFQSIAKECGENAIGIILTGMGNDGAEGLLEMKKAKGLTLIQDPESTVVFGMAGVAQSMGAVDKVIELDKIADYLLKKIYANISRHH